MIELQDKEFQRIVAYVIKNYGINLEKKRELVRTRLFNLLLERRFQSYGEFFDLVVEDESGQEADWLLDAITTNYTYFFREQTHFDFMTGQALPWIEKTVKSKDLRIWSAGCATGEEPYSIAMQLDEYFGSKKHEWDKRILATDISNQAINVAKKGQYALSDIEKIAPERVKNYFTKEQQFATINDEIKKEVIIRKLNLMEKQFPFKKKFHIIFCRNVMIYFNEETKIELVNKFYDMTEPGGYLFIGHSESLQRDQTEYKYIKPAIYRKKG